MNTDISSTAIFSEKSIDENNFNKLPMSQLNFIRHNTKNQAYLYKYSESTVFTEEIDFPIYETVEAVLKKDIFTNLQLQMQNKLLLSMRDCAAEPFEVSQLENGHINLKGTLKAILFCQQWLYHYIKNSRKSFYQKKHEDIPPKEVDNSYPQFLREGKELPQTLCFSKSGDRHDSQSQITSAKGTPVEAESKAKLITPCRQNSPTSKDRLGLVTESETLLNSIKMERDLLRCNSYNLKESTNESESQCHQKLCIELLHESVFTNNPCAMKTVSNSEKEFSSFVQENERVLTIPEAKNLQYCDSSLLKLPHQNQFVNQTTAEVNPKGSKSLKFECNKCKRIFQSSSFLHMHECSIYPPKKQIVIVTAKTPSVKKLVCEVCGYKGKYKRDYKFHLETAHPITYSCPQCSYRTTKKVHFIRHVRNVHENWRPFRCQLCDVAFKRRDALRQHQIVHLRESSTLPSELPVNGLFRCNVCKKVARSAAYLREHMLTHSEQRTFLCEVCGAAFKTRAVHRNHLRVVHSDDLRAICKYCEKSFTTKYSLKRHIRQHETREKKARGKTRLTKKEPASLGEWAPLLLTSSSDFLTRGSSVVPIAVAEKEVVVSLSKSESLLRSTDQPSGDHEKIVSSIYTESNNASENFAINIDSQIPYVIHSTQEITND